MMNRREFLQKAYRMGGLAALFSLGVSMEEAKSAGVMMLGGGTPVAAGGPGIAFGAVAYGAAFGYNADYSIALPSGTTAGDFLLACIISTESNLPTQTNPSGWTILNTGGPIVDGGKYWMMCFLRYASGAGPYVWGDLTADTKQCGFIIRMTGVYGTGTESPLDVAASLHNDGEYSTPASFVSVTTSDINRAILGVCFHNGDGITFGASTLTERAEMLGSIYLMGDIQAAAGASGAKTAAFSASDVYAAILMAIKPA
jgi:hypothetical protein